MPRRGVKRARRLPMLSSTRYSALSSLLKQEKKFSDSGAINFYVTGTTWPTVGTSSATYLLLKSGTAAAGTGLSQGSGASQRVGSKIAVMSLAAKVHIRAQGENVLQFNDGTEHAIRLVIAFDKKRAATAALPADTDFYDDVSGAPSVLSMRNMNFTKRFRIVYDRIHKLPLHVAGDGTTAATDVKSRYGAKIISIYKKFKKPVVIRWLSTSTDNASDGSDIEENSLIAFVQVLNNGASGQDVMPQIQCRIRYTDA